MAYGTVLIDAMQTSSGQVLGAGNATGFKNRIINGDMRIDQRNAGASVTNTGVKIYSLDRWFIQGVASSKFTAQQNAGAVSLPAGFTNYLGITSLAATTVGSNDYYFTGQSLEGLNVADLDWGTANAKPITIFALVYSSLTGTFGGAVRNSAANRAYPFTYTISAPNTWTPITINIAGDTSGTWLKTNGIGIDLDFSLGAGTSLSGPAGYWASANYVSATGATAVVGTAGATFYITGVQLEVGSTATSFDVRDYGRELIMCQRYWEGCSSDLLGVGYTTNGTVMYKNTPFKVVKRTAPTMTFSNVSANGFAGTQTANNVFVDCIQWKDTMTYTGNGGLYSVCSWTASAEL